MTEPPDLVCRECGATLPAASLAWCCAACGGLLDLAGPLPAELDAPVAPGSEPTPLVPSRAHEGVTFKCDHLLPTGSFKDRGAAVLAALAARFGVERALVDSSGNAGIAAAAALGRAGVEVEVLVPASTSPGKIASIRAHGGSVVTVPGDRGATADEARRRVERGGVFFASHVHQPWFAHGVRRYGLELHAQLGGRLPEVVMAPVGNGTLVLGLDLAFAELRARGLVERTPPIVAVQASACAPLAAAWAAGAAAAAPVPARRTVAEGIAIGAPPRAAQILAAVRRSGGTIIAVDDESVLRAQTGLAAQGHEVEPTAAVCTAALEEVRASRPPVDEPPARAALRGGDVVVPLCGSAEKR